MFLSVSRGVWIWKRSPESWKLFWPEKGVLPRFNSFLLSWSSILMIRDSDFWSRSSFFCDLPWTFCSFSSLSTSFMINLFCFMSFCDDWFLSTFCAFGDLDLDTFFDLERDFDLTFFRGPGRFFTNANSSYRSLRVLLCSNGIRYIWKFFLAKSLPFVVVMSLQECMALKFSDPIPLETILLWLSLTVVLPL